MAKHKNDHGNTVQEAASDGSAVDEAITPEESAAKAQAENPAAPLSEPKTPSQADPAASSNQSSGKNGAPEENEAIEWVQKTAELEAKLADINDQFLRKAADFENFRKRMIREKQELTEFANQNLLLDLLPVIDDFERAIKSVESSSAMQSSKEFTAFYEGIKLIEKGLSTMLENKWGLKRYDSEGEAFDPNRHEAIQMEKSADITEAVVKDDYLKGYLLKDRVIRFAKVKVLMPEDGPKQNEA